MFDGKNKIEFWVSFTEFSKQADQIKEFESEIFRLKTIITNLEEQLAIKIAQKES